MKYCFTTVVSDNFVYGFIAMLTTLLEKNPWIDCPFYVFYNDKECPLSKTNQDEMKKYYKNIIFYHVDLDKFAKILHTRDNVIKTPERLASAFFILESFSLEGYDKVICIDSDMIILDDLSELLEIETDLGVTRAYCHDTNLPLPFFNSGLVIIGKQYLHKDILQDISESLANFNLDSTYGKADQAVLNYYFRGKKFTYIEHSFNVTKRFYPDTILPKTSLIRGKKQIEHRMRKDGVIIMHYVNEKPWNEKIQHSNMKYSLAEGLWHDAFEKHALPSTKAMYSAHRLQQKALSQNISLTQIAG